MKRLLLYTLLVVLLVVGIVVARAPASLIEQALAAVPEASLVGTRGTLWRGNGALSVDGLSLGELSWDVAPASILTGTLSADWSLNGTGLNVEGNAEAGLTSAQVQADGEVEQTLLNRFLTAYDIQVDSGVTLDAINAELSAIDSAEPVLERLSGHLRSRAGIVRYRLAGQSDSAALPALEAALSSADGIATANVTATGDPALLMRLSLSPTGLGSVAVTKQFTEMLGRPWPGSDPGHAVVIEVREQLF